LLQAFLFLDPDVPRQGFKRVGEADHHCTCDFTCAVSFDAQPIIDSFTKLSILSLSLFNVDDGPAGTVGKETKYCDGSVRIDPFNDAQLVGDVGFGLRGVDTSEKNKISWSGVLCDQLSTLASAFVNESESGDVKIHGQAGVKEIDAGVPVRGLDKANWIGLKLE
jgi:hypothetical protein